MLHSPVLRISRNTAARKRYERIDNAQLIIAQRHYRVVSGQMGLMAGISDTPWADYYAAQAAAQAVYAAAMAPALALRQIGVADAQMDFAIAMAACLPAGLG